MGATATALWTDGAAETGEVGDKVEEMIEKNGGRGGGCKTCFSFSLKMRHIKNCGIVFVFFFLSFFFIRKEND